MHARKSLILLVAGLSIGGAAGWLLRGAGELSPDAAGKPGVINVKPVGKPGDRAPTGAALTLSGTTADAVMAAIPAADSPEFAETIRAIFRDPMKERRLGRLQILLERFSPEHYEAMIPLIRENDLRGTSSGDEWSMLWGHWGQKDAASAMKFVQSQDWSGWDPAAPAEAQSRSLIGWAVRDPEAARRYIEESSDRIFPGRELSYALIKGWTATDPAAAGNWLLQRGKGSGEEYRMVIEAISRSGGQQAVDAWFANASRGAEAENVRGFAEAVSAMKRKYEPEKAAGWIEQHLQETWIEQSPVVANTAQSFASRDPAGAMEWAGRTGLGTAAAVAMQRWCQDDFDAACTWLRDHRDAPHYAVSVGVIVRQLKSENPEAARIWAQSIPDEAARQSLLSQLNIPGE